MKPVKSITLVVPLLLVCTTLSAGNPANSCSCRAKNVVVTTGESACIKTPSGWRIARCTKVLNNTAWVFLTDSCSASST